VPDPYNEFLDRLRETSHFCYRCWRVGEFVRTCSILSLLVGPLAATGVTKPATGPETFADTAQRAGVVLGIILATAFVGVAFGSVLMFLARKRAGL